MDLQPDAPTSVAPSVTPRRLAAAQAEDPNLWRVIDTSLHEQYLQVALRSLHGVIENEPDNEPHLGLATTRQLLDELAVRMAVTQNSNKGRELGALCQEAIGNLAPSVLDYRTFDS